jgi:hypothetical protein
MTLEEKLKSIKVGDTVRLRCGGEVVVTHICNLYKDIHTDGMFWFKDGSRSQTQSPFDIIDVIPAPFGWDTVKQGMGFKRIGTGDFWVFVAFAKEGVVYCNYSAVFVNKDMDIFSWDNYKDVFTRAPEHDI